MENSGEVLEKREKKIFNWLKNRYNLAFVLVIGFAIIIRIYYFILTYNQPLWWDEAEYMNIAKRFAFGTDYWFDPVRQVLFSFVSALFLRISNTEFFPRLIVLLLSITSVITLYYLGKEMYDKKIGLIAALFMSVFYMNLFFSYRLLNDIASLAFFTLSAFLFYRYFKTNSHKALYIASAAIAIGTLFKLTTASLLFVVLIYFLATEKLKFLKKKEIWISALIFILILSPYIIWGYMEYGGFVILKAQEAITSSSPVPLYVTWPTVLKDYVKMLPYYLFLGFGSSSSIYWFLSLVLIFGLVILSMYRLIIGFDILLKENNEKTSELRRDLYLILLLILPFILVSLLITHNEDRYIINSFPALFIIFGVFIMKGYSYFEKKQLKFVGVLLVIILLMFFVFVQIKSSDSTIKTKITSYSQVKDAALWFKANSLPSDIMATVSEMQVRYYSDRKTTKFPDTKEEFESKTIPEKNPKYYMLSGFEQGPAWSRSYPQEKNLTIAAVFFLDQQKTQPMVIIYELPKTLKTSTPKTSLNLSNNITSINKSN